MRKLRSVDTGNVQNEPEHQLGLLRSKARAAEKARKRDAAMGYWQEVLGIEPTDYEASRASENTVSCSLRSVLLLGTSISSCNFDHLNSFAYAISQSVWH